jgi:hypothetical protein
MKERAPLAGALTVAAAAALITVVPSNTTSAADDDPAKARAAFAVIAKVLQHPRCRNCHPDGDRPLLGDPPVVHRMNVQRRLEEVGMRCATCHQKANVPGPHRPPGAPHWGLAPREQVFEGRTAAQLCEALKNPATNGDRTLEQIHAHLTEDALVRWGWAPGEGREPVSVPQPEFARAVREWIDAGAHCPEEKR